MIRSTITFAALTSAVLLAMSSPATAQEACRSKISEVVSTYRANSGACDMGDSRACQAICDSFGASGVIQPQPGPSVSCTEDQARLIRSDERQKTLEMVRADMAAEGVSRASAVGADEQDCLNKARSRAQGGAYNAIQTCNSHSTFFKNCQIAGERVIQSPTFVQATRAGGHVDERDNRIDEANCRQRAQNAAIENALNSCRSSTGANCSIVSGPTPASFKTEQRRRYGIMGPKDTYLICDSVAEAMPDQSARFQCSVEIFAKNRF